MKKVKLDQEMFGLSSLMERITGTRVKDCFKDDEGSIYFVVAKGFLGKAVGKGGVNIKKVEKNLGRKVRVIEFSDDSADFIRNIIYPIKVDEICEEEDYVVIKDSNRKTKSALIGRGGKKLQLINRAVKRFFSKEVKVV